jgi:hypothetical protein
LTLTIDWTTATDGYVVTKPLARKVSAVPAFEEKRLARNAP